MASDYWSMATAAVYVPGSGPEEPGAAIIFHSNGIFRVNLADGSYKKVASSTWDGARAAVCIQGEALVFHESGIFRVNVVDGSYTKVTSSRWDNTKAAIYIPEATEGQGSILVLHSCGVFRVNVEDGSHKMVSREGWDCLSAICPLGTQTYCSCMVGGNNC